VRQLRLRDIGGIIVIDFIDMANPKNRATVEEALQSELERDRTKTYVVEISPLGLVEMTRQNVTDGPREILTRRCTVCGGDGVVLSETSAAVDAERKLRALAASAPRTKAFAVELRSKVASILIGPGASRLAEIEELTKRRFFIVARDDVPTDHFEVLDQGSIERLAPEAPIQEGAELELKLVEVGLHDVSAGVAKLDGYTVCVGNASSLVGKKAKVRIERVLEGIAYSTVVGTDAQQEQPITAEGEAEKPTRKPPARKGQVAPKVEQEPEEETEPEAAEEQELAVEPEPKPAERPKTRRKPRPKAKPKPEAEPEAAEAASGREETGRAADELPKKKTRRGSRGGRRRRKKPATDAAAAATANGEGPRIHLPDPGLGRDEPEAAEAPSSDGNAEGTGAPKPRKKTRRGSRGGRNRRRRSASGAAKPESTPAE
jgi:ribonuclease G